MLGPAAAADAVEESGVDLVGIIGFDYVEEVEMEVILKRQLDVLI